MINSNFLKYKIMEYYNFSKLTGFKNWKLFLLLVFVIINTVDFMRCKGKTKPYHGAKSKKFSGSQSFGELCCWWCRKRWWKIQQNWVWWHLHFIWIRNTSSTTKSASGWTIGLYHRCNFFCFSVAADYFHCLF